MHPTIFNLYRYSFIEADHINLRQMMNQMFSSIGSGVLDQHATPANTAHISLSGRLRTINPEFFESVFDALILNFSSNAEVFT